MPEVIIHQLQIRHERWPLATPFRISRGVKSEAEVIVVEVTTLKDQVLLRGLGECVPYARYGETVHSVIAAIESVRHDIERGAGRIALQQLLPAGAARNALDAALWDLEARSSGQTVAELTGLHVLQSLTSAFTVTLDTPARMAEAAARIASMSLIKVKVDAHDPAAQILAVHRAAPAARLIVDANEAWDFELLRTLQQTLVACGAVLVEQPLPAGADDSLEGFTPSVPICADESCHTIGDLPALRRRYQAVNLKLDKTGGLTAAIELAAAAREAGFLLMVGCMVCTSLSIAPAWVLASEADFVDLDGPLLLAGDRAGGVLLQDGRLQVPQPGFWGGPPNAC